MARKRALRSESRQPPNRSGERGVVIVPVALCDQPVLQRRRECGHRERCTDVGGESERDPEVLAMKSNLEPQWIFVVDHSTTAIGQYPRTRRAAAKCRDHLFDVQSRLEAKGYTFGD